MQMSTDSGWVSFREYFIKTVNIVHLCYFKNVRMSQASLHPRSDVRGPLQEEWLSPVEAVKNKHTTWKSSFPVVIWYMKLFEISQKLNWNIIGGIADEKVVSVQVMAHCQLTHCGLVTPCGNIDLSHPWLR